ncbi:MAG: cell surface protein SprA [Bacteroidales bacterium]
MDLENYKITKTIIFVTLWALAIQAEAHNSFFQTNSFQESFPENDTIRLPYNFEDVEAFPFFQTKKKSPLFLDYPDNIESSSEYDTEKDEYILRQQIGEFDYRPPAHIDREQYWDYQFEQMVRDYWRQKASGAETSEEDEGLIPQLELGGEAFNRLFGSNTIDIVPQGAAELIFGVNINRVDDPKLSEKLRKTTTFDFEEKIQMNVSGTIGDKIKLGINYDTEATFDFENQTKLEYGGDEDEIIQEIEAGNVSLPLPGSLITGSQSLFGLKTKLKFGNLDVSTVFSQQEGQSQVIQLKGGAKTQDFEIKADEYDENRHFFLSHKFKENYDKALRNLPLVSSDIEITDVEVWVTNKTSNFENSRNIIAFMDLGEEKQENVLASDAIINNFSGSYPHNNANNLYEKLTSTSFEGIRNISETNKILEQWQQYDFQSGKDFVKLENARKLNENEYTINRKLGYISLKSSLRKDEVIAVAYEYNAKGSQKKVGELSQDGISSPEALIVKMIKGTSFTPKYPNWELMMKNIYSIDGYEVNKEGFKMDILYQDDRTGNTINYIPEGKLSETLLLQVMNLDNTNSQLDANPDGMFDFIPGVTILPDDGKIIFPVREPFGSHLKKQFENEAIAEKYIFEELYDSTLTIARQTTEKNKFILQGEYESSSSSEISLNAMNIPEGSVVVTAGGRKLTENVDYTVDYNLGRVKILDESLIQSSTPIQISLENQESYSMQKKTMIGTHLNYNVSEDFKIGATVLNLTERPLTKKVNIREEPISNTIWGLNTSYRTETPFLTKLIDKLPFLDTKEESNITFEGEFAHLIPGHSKAIEKEGNAYIDDFEGSETSIDLKNPSAWVFASTPQGQNEIFPEGSKNNDWAYNYNRAKLAWYHIDPLFLRENSPNMPQYIKSNPDLRSSHFVREIFEEELFPNRDNPADIPASIQVLNLAYFPDEKGPYNFEHSSTGEIGISSGINPDESLKEPESRWGGIMREISTTDFEESNVEYIEFWLMDPFVYDSTNTNDGNLYFNLGDISEDILKDSRKSFEHGLPPPDEMNKVDTTMWGRVPSSQSMVTAFDNDPEVRQYQDIGLDGLSNENEYSFFGEDHGYLDSLRNVLDPEVFEEKYGGNPEESDVANDDYHYYRGSDYDAERRGIIERYKNYNNPDGNSPTDEQSPENYPTSGKTQPDVEDINQDNTLDENESYYQYKVSLDPEEMEVGQNYIIDKVTRNVDLANGEKSQITWYQFRIPVRDPDKRVGAIRDFNSIKYMRMFLRGFQDSVILRFAKLNLVRGEWRQYTKALNEAGEDLSAPEYTEGNLKISAVNIEENADKTPVNYVLPPGIDRVTDPTNPQLRQLNEQAIVFKVNNLEDGDARAAFKNVNLDVRQYNKIKMFLHTEALEEEQLQDGDLRAFIRLGTDYRNNYYEYEIPLKVTSPGRYSNDSESDRHTVWPNEMVIDLNTLPKIKLQRNNAIGESSNINFQTIYSIIQDDARISVRGNPNLSDVRTIMLGIRNPHQKNNSDSDDGLRKSGEIWMNELRLSDFKEEGGWAARGRVSSQLADFATVNFSGNLSTPGFGSIEQKVNERSKEQVTQYDLSTNLNLGKFFSEKMGVKIPFYIGLSENVITPEYNPINPDVKLNDALNAQDTKRERDSIKNISQDYSSRKSINFTNIRINPQDQDKNPIYGISNFSFNYAYNEMFNRNINTKYNVIRDHKGGITYDYNTRPKNIQPFKGAGGILNSSLLRLIKDFNFYYMPSSFSFKTSVERHYNAFENRNINNPQLTYEPSFSKDFLWDRQYRLQFDLTRSIKLNYSATNRARIDEPRGIVDKNKAPQEYEQWKDSVYTNIRNFGRNTDFQQKWDLSYRVPINKIPLLDWVNLSTNYNGTYNWQAGANFSDTSDINLGNTIRNSNTLQLNSQFNLTNLYNKVGFLNDINKKYQSQGQSSKKIKTVQYEEDQLTFKEGEPIEIRHDLNTEEIQAKAYQSNGREIAGKVDVVNQRKITFTPGQDDDNAMIRIQGEIEDKDSPLTIIAENFARVLMGVKNISVSWSRTQGSELPGYNPGTKYMGLTQTNDEFAPGIPFILGWQNENFADLARANNWITNDPRLSSPFLLTETENLSLRSTIEPIPGIQINLSGSRVKSDNSREYYVYNDSIGGIENYGFQQEGSFSMSFLTIGTAFDKISQENNYQSKAFNKFREYRTIISKRLGEKRQKEWEEDYNPGNEEYADGYGKTSQDVLVPAFLSAYGEYKPQNAPLGVFPQIPFPNWRVNFNKLNQIDFVKKILKNVNISHSYKSTYSLGSFLYNQEFDDIEQTFASLRDQQNNYIAKFDINTISINEQFNPLINFDLTWQNNLTTKFQLSKSRRVTLSLANNQITETLSEEYSVSMGYRFEDFNLIVDFGGQEQTMENDLNIRTNFKLRENLTILRKLDDEVDDQITAGQKNIVIGMSADYALSNRFNVKAFFDRNVNEPKISRSYPTANTNFGFSLRFSLSE